MGRAVGNTGYPIVVSLILSSSPANVQTNHWFPLKKDPMIGKDVNRSGISQNLPQKCVLINAATRRFARIQWFVKPPAVEICNIRTIAQPYLAMYLASSLTWAYNYAPKPLAEGNGCPYENLSVVPTLWGGQISEPSLSTLKKWNQITITSSLSMSQICSLPVAICWYPKPYQYRTPKSNLCQISALSQGQQQGIPELQEADFSRECSTRNKTVRKIFCGNALCNCTIDFVAAHFYCTSQGLQGYLSGFHTTYPTPPICLTELDFPNEQCRKICHLWTIPSPFWIVLDGLSSTPISETSQWAGEGVISERTGCIRKNGSCGEIMAGIEFNAARRK